MRPSAGERFFFRVRFSRAKSLVHTACLGTEALGASIARTCELARYLEARILRTPELELVAPVTLNIACFRYRLDDAHPLNARIAIELQESGVAAPSTTVIGGKLALRAAIVNHCNQERDLDPLVDKTLAPWPEFD
jgi:glutamate/tyrosine decarboxylase-like PLP-dependent enzyme